MSVIYWNFAPYPPPFFDILIFHLFMLSRDQSIDTLMSNSFDLDPGWTYKNIKRHLVEFFIILIESTADLYSDLTSI